MTLERGTWHAPASANREPYLLLLLLLLRLLLLSPLLLSPLLPLLAPTGHRH
jgi:hypothetical protein